MTVDHGLRLSGGLPAGVKPLMAVDDQPRSPMEPTLAGSSSASDGGSTATCIESVSSAPLHSPAYGALTVTSSGALPTLPSAPSAALRRSASATCRGPAVSGGAERRRPASPAARARGTVAVPVAEHVFGHKLLDRSVARCTVCTARFSLLRRRHWCRRCGGIICAGCGRRERQLWTGGPSVRVCAPCAVPAVLALDRAGLLDRVFACLPGADLANAWGATRAFHRPRHLPYAFPRVASIHDDYGPELRFVERGSFAAVHASTCRRTGKKVAIKAISKSGVRNLPEWQRVVREIELHSAADHPNVVRVERVCQTEHHIYVVMELADGDLFTWLSRKKASEAVALRVVEQLLAALSFLHNDRRVVHRDVKLENMLVFPPAEGEEAPTVKLCDFGFAKGLSAFGGGARSPAPSPAGRRTLPVDPVEPARPVEPGTVPCTPCGTTLYFPPEVLRGVAALPRAAPSILQLPTEQLPKLDTFSAGVVLHFLLRRREPFRGGPAAQAAQTIAAGVRWPAVGSGEHGADAHECTRELVTDLLRDDPLSRPGSEEALRRARRALSQLSIPSPVTPAHAPGHS